MGSFIYYVNTRKLRWMSYDEKIQSLIGKKGIITRTKVTAATTTLQHSVRSAIRERHISDMYRGILVKKKLSPAACKGPERGRGSFTRALEIG